MLSSRPVKSCSMPNAKLPFSTSLWSTFWPRTTTPSPNTTWPA